MPRGAQRRTLERFRAPRHYHYGCDGPRGFARWRLVSPSGSLSLLGNQGSFGRVLCTAARSGRPRFLLRATRTMRPRARSPVTGAMLQPARRLTSTMRVRASAPAPGARRSPSRRRRRSCRRSPSPIVRRRSFRAASVSLDPLRHFPAPTLPDRRAPDARPSRPRESSTRSA